MRFLAPVLMIIAVAVGCGKDAAPREVEEVNAPERATAADPAALEILAKSAEAYRKLRTYKDEILIITNGSGFMPREGSGRTAFEKDGRFLFEVRAKDPYGPGMTTDKVTVKDGKAYLFMSVVGNDQEERPLANALSTIMTTSAHASMIVPTLLMPDAFEGKTFYQNIGTPRLADDMKLGSVSYYRIEGDRGFGVLIDKTTLLIKRVLLPGKKGTLDYSVSPNASVGEIDLR